MQGAGSTFHREMILDGILPVLIYTWYVQRSMFLGEKRNLSHLDTDG